ncbi:MULTISPECIES: ankyrin repeat domain-containing protein [Hyunsoonleella]|uniref:Ankyrin repeat domain-containing protein n=2 Tax=Hyunsoonleella TaxID=1080193 RepID=A0A923H995_9FLAO|nr:ankyrin repeat domain-containing protein [Hyunsoonleella aquatilis]MBC3757317.1 ankyrin repeat domain-containing protein [Hyunsoonleella aquatilis]
MKKTIILSAIALCVSFLNVNATTTIENSADYGIQAVYEVNPFCVSIAKGDFDTVKKLIDRGVDINQKSNGMTPVMYAAKFNRTEILKLLIEKGAKLKTKSDKGMTAMKYAKIHKATDAEAVLKEALTKKKK